MLDLPRLRRMEAQCPDEFETYRKCMDKTQMRLPLCRKEEQDLFENYYKEV